MKGSDVPDIIMNMSDTDEEVNENRANSDAEIMEHSPSDHRI